MRREWSARAPRVAAALALHGTDGMNVRYRRLRCTTAPGPIADGGGAVSPAGVIDAYSGARTCRHLDRRLKIAPSAWYAVRILFPSAGISAGGSIAISIDGPSGGTAADIVRSNVTTLEDLTGRRSTGR